MSTEEPYYIAHTARCKLKLEAERPDRNLRFILGHAFTLDKLILRIVEIESESSDDDNVSEDPGVSNQTEHDPHVKFYDNNQPHTTTRARKRSPSPNQDHLDGSDSESSGEASEYDDDVEEDNGLSLRRYASASAQPPRMVDDKDDSSSDEDEPKSPPSIPSEAELESITQGPENEELTDLYQSVKKCPCHGQHESAPAVMKAWDVPQKDGQQGKRVAVVQIVV